MTKSMVTKTWIAGLVVLAAGLVAAAIGVGLMLGYGGTFTQTTDPSQMQFVPDYSGFFWTTIWVIVLGGILAAVGGIVQFVAWIGALVNSYLLPEKTWFAIVLIGGLLGFFFGLIGFAAMVAYVIAAPDGTPYKKPQITAAPSSLAPTS